MLRLQEVLLWIKSVVEECGENITTEQLKDYVWKTLNSGKVIYKVLFLDLVMGFLSKTDLRYTCQREFALKHLPDDPLFQLLTQFRPDQVSKLCEAVPPILTELGRATLFFQLIWERALGLPLETSKSVTMGRLENHCKKAASS
ncbi:hypothetical protein POTOM_033971 [Populus tomentosa]|uniref:Uncharacterized protein n=1 Tax=Populus tomentosa TaxID=118781 RepID=A0A8X8CFR4_POPTO|nr:hypothetical protein POTOM_033971 [Populus tomentosa]